MICHPEKTKKKHISWAKQVSCPSLSSHRRDPKQLPSLIGWELLPQGVLEKTVQLPESILKNMSRFGREELRLFKVKVISKMSIFGKKKCQKVMSNWCGISPSALWLRIALSGKPDEKNGQNAPFFERTLRYKRISTFYTRFCNIDYLCANICI